MREYSARPQVERGEAAFWHRLPEGAAVKSVVEDGPAAKAGLQENDIITAVDGQTVSGSSELADIVSASEPGAILVLTVYRQGQTEEIKVEVGENVQSALPDESQSQEQQQPTEGSLEEFFSQLPGGSDS